MAILKATSGIDSPTMQKREAQTVLDVKDGEIVVMAGLDETRDTSTISGLAFLPSWLRGSSDRSSRSQVLLLLEVRRVPVAI